MVSPAISGYVGASGKRLNQASSAESCLPSTHTSLTPIYGFLYPSATEETRNEDDYSDILTDVTDADEVYAEQCEASSVTKSLMRSLRRVDSLDLVSNDINGPSSMKKTLTRSKITLEPSQKNKQLSCASFWRASEYAELLFDADTPFASDEDLALRSIFAPGSIPEPVTRLATRSHDKHFPTPKLINTSHLRIQPDLAVRELHDRIPNIPDFDAPPLSKQVRDVRPKSTFRLEGRSLLCSHPPVFAEETVTGEPWQLEHDPVLRYTTASSLLPGLDNLQNITARSATIQYDHSIEDLYYATSSFLDDCHDGECTCLDGKMHSLRVPGENFKLSEKDDNFDFSVRRPTAKDIFQSIDELVDADMFDVHDDSKGFSGEVLHIPGVHFDTNPQDVGASMVLDRLLCSSSFDALSLVCDNENDSDVSDSDAETFSLTQHPELTYVDANTHQCVAYTALNQLLAMEEDETRPVIHRDTPDEDNEPAEIGLAKLVYLPPRAEGHATLLPLQSSPNLHRSSSDSNSGISRPPALVQPELNLRPIARQRCEPYGLYSSNRSRHQRQLPQLKLDIQLLPNHQPLSMVPEEKPPCSSSSSSAESLNFAEHRGFVKPLERRRLGFLDDGGEGKDGSEPPATPNTAPDCIYEVLNITNIKDYEDLFADTIWNSTPDLKLTKRSQEAYANTAPASVIPPSPLLEALKIEIHSRLTFMFNCMNSGLFNELPALSSDLHWTLCALANDYPALTLLDTLGVAVEILVERMVASIAAS
ncbi:hypothetical protein G6011_07310 [Alternaria panax]|uniref:Uncharacterized protein n=1 Tax=Alternaria panax TaxID=48097 RepID=A0AAD4FEK9_9PLEO|nr:hypothetical protein G6011_07310 [Alternaria panax]